MIPDRRVHPITDENQKTEIIGTKFYKTTPGLPKNLFAFEADGNIVGYICVEHPNPHVGFCHLYVYPEYKTKRNIEIIKWLGHNVVFPILKETGKTGLMATCSLDDHGTRQFLSDMKFNLTEAVVAQLPL